MQKFFFTICSGLFKFPYILIIEVGLYCHQNYSNLTLSLSFLHILSLSLSASVYTFFIIFPCLMHTHSQFLLYTTFFHSSTILMMLIVIVETRWLGLGQGTSAMVSQSFFCKPLLFSSPIPYSAITDLGFCFTSSTFGQQLSPGCMLMFLSSLVQLSLVRLPAWLLPCFPAGLSSHQHVSCAAIL